jgi:hypothetical protein
MVDLKETSEPIIWIGSDVAPECYEQVASNGYNVFTMVPRSTSIDRDLAAIEPSVVLFTKSIQTHDIEAGEIPVDMQVVIVLNPRRMMIVTDDKGYLGTEMFRSFVRATTTNSRNEEDVPLPPTCTNEYGSSYFNELGLCDKYSKKILHGTGNDLTIYLVERDSDKKNYSCCCP